jgi:hypothetical protein
MKRKVFKAGDTMIKYIIGDATHPTSAGLKFITHISNDCHAWGAGFVLALSKRWPQPEAVYRVTKVLTLGDIQVIPVEPDITVINMIAQSGIGRRNGPPIRYPALEQCLKKVGDLALEYHATVIGPRFGSGLAGGNWEAIEMLIDQQLCQRGIEVTIYDLK